MFPPLDSAPLALSPETPQPGVSSLSNIPRKFSEQSTGMTLSVVSWVPSSVISSVLLRYGSRYWRVLTKRDRRYSWPSNSSVRYDILYHWPCFFLSVNSCTVPEMYFRPGASAWTARCWGVAIVVMFDVILTVHRR